MQQLTLQFEGYADNRQPETQGTATQCRTGVFYEAFQHFFRGLVKSVTRPSRKFSVGTWLVRENRLFSAIAGESLSNLKALQGTAAVAFGFSMIFFAAIIGG